MALKRHGRNVAKFLRQFCIGETRLFLAKPLKAGNSFEKPTYFKIFNNKIYIYIVFMPVLRIFVSIRHIYQKLTVWHPLFERVRRAILFREASSPPAL